MNFFSDNAFLPILAVCAGLLVLQLIWVLAHPPLVRKPRTWFLSLPFKFNSILVPALAAASLF